jgi:ribosomal protein S12 methylthiotransferase
MHRYGDREKLTNMIFRIRKKVPGITLRTTFIVGFPGETEEDFEELCSFSKEIQFERMGCFAYSQEEGTEAAALSGQIEEDEKMRRQEILMEAQMNRMQELGESKIGEQLLVLCEGYDQEEKVFFGRTQSDAPEIDGRVWFEVPGESNPNAGDFVKVKVTDCVDCDLIGILSEGGNE